MLKLHSLLWVGGRPWVRSASRQSHSTQDTAVPQPLTSGQAGSPGKPQGRWQCESLSGLALGVVAGALGGSLGGVGETLILRNPLGSLAG